MLQKEILSENDYLDSEIEKKGDLGIRKRKKYIIEEIFEFYP